MQHSTRRNPWAWIPSLYFASGLPYHAITSIPDIMYKDLGLSNTSIALYTGILLVPWSIKPLWSPFVETISTRRNWTLYSQLLLAISFSAIAFTIPSDSYILLTFATLMIGAFVSSTHDIALDGFYILGLTQKEQSFFSGIRNTFYRIATVFCSGVLVMFAGKMSIYTGNERQAWSITFAVTALIMATLFLYHKKTMPKPEKDITQRPKSISEIFSNYGDIIKSYFQKPNIWATLFFLLLFRFPEAQLGKISKLFLMDSLAAGGLELTKGDIGFLNGVIGVIGLIIGGVVGGICIAQKGLKYWLWPMVVAISLPDIVYLYMSIAKPDNLMTIGSCIFIEQLGYGFGFTAYTLYMIYFAQGKYPTAHFAISTAFMSLGLMLPGMLSGVLQEWMGYKGFFIWIMACCAVTFIVSAFLKIDKDFGKK